MRVVDLGGGFIAGSVGRSVARARADVTHAFMGARRPAPPAPRRLAPLARTDAHSAWFLSLLVVLNVVDAFHLNVVWPMLPFLVASDARVEARDVGFYVGVCGAASPLGAMCGAYAWGRVSDARGRRPALIAGCVASTLVVYAFGTATTTRRAALGRFASGLANGNAAIVKTYVGEITTKVSAGRAFGVLALGYGLASAAAPGVGGYLQRPAERWPRAFAGTVFETYPYLLPMVVASALTFAGAVLGWMFLPETASFTMRQRQEERRRRRRGDASRGEEAKRLVKLASAGELQTFTDDHDDDGEVADGVVDVEDARTLQKTPTEEVLFTPETTIAVACYALLAAIAIGYDELIPVYLKTDRNMGGCGFSPSDIGLLLIAGGVTLLIFQLTLYTRICDALGAVRAFRFGVSLFAGISILAPFASLAPNDTMLWIIALTSQCVKICALGIGFVSITIVVNNSCEDAVKARVNAISGSTSAFARVVSPVVCGWMFSMSMRLQDVVPFHQVAPFVFISVVALGLRVASERLPLSLDASKNDTKTINDDVGGDDDDGIELIETSLNSRSDEA